MIHAIVTQSVVVGFTDEFSRKSQLSKIL